MQSENLQLKTSSGGRLFLCLDQGEWKEVQVRCCFPWSLAGQFFSLRDIEGTELAVVESVDDLDAKSASALSKVVGEAQFCFHVTDILSINETFELWSWTVSTKNGNRQFQTRMDTWPRALPSSKYMVQDLYGDLYIIPHPRDLSPNGGKLFWSFVD